MRTMPLSLTLLVVCVMPAFAQVQVVGIKAPEIKGEDVDGKSMRLSEFRGKVVMLDFWGNW
jgi:hypothetical protein